MSTALISLDFVPTKRHSVLAGVVLLAAGLAIAAFTVLDYLALTDEVAVVQMQLSDADEPVAERRAAAIPESRRNAVQQALEELSRPWVGLFAELESAGIAQENRVALLEIEPDSQRGRLRIVAEASSLPNAIAYVESLQQGSALSFPMLDRHEIRTDVPERPVYFELSAGWSAAE